MGLRPVKKDAPLELPLVFQYACQRAATKTYKRSRSRNRAWLHWQKFSGAVVFDQVQGFTLPPILPSLLTPLGAREPLERESSEMGISYLL